ncbi:hypothetical protein [Streptomyces djakartensis]|uniref:hypothetical protein n=1 Tax=Streptomyces djakartensis TaxID=68193 RepID=UPI0034DE5FD2
MDPFHCGIEHVAAWAGTYLVEQLDGRPFDGPSALAHVSEHHRAAALTHDRRITALTQFYKGRQRPRRHPRAGLGRPGAGFAS